MGVLLDCLNEDNVVEEEDVGRLELLGLLFGSTDGVGLWFAEEWERLVRIWSVACGEDNRKLEFSIGSIGLFRLGFLGGNVRKDLGIGLG